MERRSLEKNLDEYKRKEMEIRQKREAAQRFGLFQIPPDESVVS